MTLQTCPQPQVPDHTPVKIASSENILFVDFRNELDEDWVVATPENERAAARSVDDQIERAHALAMEIAAETRELERLLFGSSELRLV